MKDFDNIIGHIIKQLPVIKDRGGFKLVLNKKYDILKKELDKLENTNNNAINFICSIPVQESDFMPESTLVDGNIRKLYGILFEGYSIHTILLG